MSVPYNLKICNRILVIAKILYIFIFFANISEQFPAFNSEPHLLAPCAQVQLWSCCQACVFHLISSLQAVTEFKYDKLSEMEGKYPQSSAQFDKYNCKK